MLKAVCSTPLVGSMPQSLKQVRLTSTGIEYDQRFGVIDVLSKELLLRRTKLGSLALIASKMQYYQPRNSERRDLLQLYFFDSSKSLRPFEGVSYEVSGIERDTETTIVTAEDMDVEVKPVPRNYKANVALSFFLGREVEVVYLVERKAPYVEIDLVKKTGPIFTETSPTIQGFHLPEKTNVLVDAESEVPDYSNLPIQGNVRFTALTGMQERAEPYASLSLLSIVEDVLQLTQLTNGTIKPLGSSLYAPNL